MIVAAVGLLQSSTAVVIGAMLIAPLMAPIIGITVDLRWIPVSESDPRKPDAPVALDRIRPIAEQWLAAQSLTPDGLSYDQTRIRG